MKNKHKNGDIVSMNWEQYKWSNGAFFIFNPDIGKQSFKKVMRENKSAVLDLYKISLILSGNYVEGINKFRY